MSFVVGNFELGGFGSLDVLVYKVRIQAVTYIKDAKNK